jgi:hypothetical protein
LGSPRSSLRRIRTLLEERCLAAKRTEPEIHVVVEIQQYPSLIEQGEAGCPRPTTALHEAHHTIGRKRKVT